MDFFSQILKTLPETNDFFEIERRDGHKSKNYFDKWMAENIDIGDWECSLLEHLKEGNVLDIGCGTGKHVEYLNGKEIETKGIDNSEGAIKIGRGYGRNIELGDFWNLDESTKYDNIILMDCSIGLIESIENLSSFLQKTRRLLAPNGRLLITSVNWREGKGDHLDYIKKQISQNKFPGEIELRLKYKDIETDWFKWTWVDSELLFLESMNQGFSAQYFSKQGSKYGVILENNEEKQRYFKSVSGQNMEWELSGDQSFPFFSQSYASFNKLHDSDARVVQYGPFRLSIEVEESIMSRIKFSVLNKLAKKFKQKFSYEFFVGGSHSPLSSKTPTSFSDLDLVIPIDLSTFKVQEIQVFKRKCLRFFEKYFDGAVDNISVSIISNTWMQFPCFVELVNPLKDKNFWKPYRNNSKSEMERRSQNATKMISKINLKSILNEIKLLNNIEVDPSKVFKIVLSPRWHDLVDSSLVRLNNIKLESYATSLRA